MPDAGPAPPNYLEPGLPAGLPTVDVPVVDATSESLEGLGAVARSAEHPVEIVRWPAQGWRAVDSDSGDEGGTTEGVFEVAWQGQVLYAGNSAVGGRYVLGYGTDPARAREDADGPVDQVLLWHANYHPDGGQVFWPLSPEPFVVPLAPPGDDVTPDQFVAFRSDGTYGIYVRPGVWHDGAFPLGRRGRWLTRQGRVHARVSCDFAREFGCLLRVALAHSPASAARARSG